MHEFNAKSASEIGGANEPEGPLARPISHQAMTSKPTSGVENSAHLSMS